MAAIGSSKMLVLLCLTVILVPGISAVDITTDVGLTVTLICPLTDSFPDWFGPPDLSPLTSDNDVTVEGMEYVDDKNLRINNVSVHHAGEYRCRGNGEAVVMLIVNSYAYRVEFEDIQDIQVTGKPDVQALTPSTGEVYTVTCTVRNAYPEPDITITIPESNVTVDQSSVNKNVTLANNTYTVVAFVELTSEQINDVDNEYIVCNATKEDNSVASTQLIRVLHPPGDVVIEESEMLSQANHTGRYKCSQSNVWPPVVFTWSFNGSTSLTSRFEPKHSCTQDSDGLYTCMSEMEASFTKVDNGLVLNCHMHFVEEEASHHTFTIHFEWRPSSVTILGNTVDGPDGGVAEATCNTDSHNDQTPVKIMWKIANEDIDITFTVVNETTDSGEYKGVITSQTVQFPVTKNMTGYRLVCYMDFNSSIMSAKPLKIFYAPTFILPYSPILHAYIDHQLNIQCLVDSVPPAVMALSLDGTAISITDDNTTDNSLTYSIAKLVDHGVDKSYVCSADNSVFQPVTKTFHITGHDFPGMPTFIPASHIDAASVEFHTSGSPPTIPRTFYVQYKLTSSDYWLEVTEGIPDTQPGQSSRKIKIDVYNLEAGGQYAMRLKSVDLNGLVAYSNESTFLTPAAEETVPEYRYNNAIIISVFATFGFMLIVGAIIFCCYKRGVCCSRSKGVDLVAM